MRRAVLVLMLAIAPCIGQSDELRGRVVGVADGDTLTVLDAGQLRILVKLATNNASKLAGDNASTCPLQKELQAES